MGFVPRDRWSRRGACGGVAVQQCRGVGQEAGAAGRASVSPALPLPIALRAGLATPRRPVPRGGRRGEEGRRRCRERGGVGERAAWICRGSWRWRRRAGGAPAGGGGGGAGGGQRRRRGGGGREQERGGDRGNRVEGEGVIAKMACGVIFIKNDKILEFLLLRVEINFSLRAYSKNM